MKRIEAYIRVNKLEDVKQSLEDVGVFGLSVGQIRGYGRQLGRTDKYRGSTYAVNLLPKLHLEVFVTDEQAEEAVEAVVRACQTGEIGDGKIFVSDVIDAIRIRTGERGASALS
ncbi:P-II family nitrogen regulator [Fimbriimonas ginsengisoli]|uniref:Nitrogen regulatory protein P-II n=1 Tax=Fimbriimonas ginsengisoli Gsoil 348 TaxID=661478 RepID=A0A068NXT2_FIMGI|nr:P-II family nitrogen regulator [Fimbriimonas ginsengisoli]AIE87555.1 Nitrogen regulatory protein P-II [Fimbriimonas ginsengisoli Gsoil 348]